MDTGDIVAYGFALLFFLIVIGLIIYIIMKNSGTYEETGKILFKSFAGYESAPHALDATKEGDGKAILECPAGKTINIIDARYELADTYKACTQTPIGGITANADCQLTNQRDAKGVLIPPGGGNPKAPGPWGCSIRDATMYVAKIANGKQKVILSNFDGGFGPDPCPGRKGSTTNLPDGGEFKGNYIHGIYTCM